MDDSLELFSAFGNVAFTVLVGLAAALAWVVTARRSRIHRVALSTLSALVVAVGLVVTAHLALANLGEAPRTIVRVEPTVITLHRRWTTPQRRLVILASLSPFHRTAVMTRLHAPRVVTEVFPPLDDSAVTQLRAWLRARGECALESLLDRRLGEFERAATTPCARPGGAREAAEAALALGDIPRAWSLLEARRSEVRDGFDARILALHPSPPDAALSTLPMVPAHERPRWTCILARVQQRIRGDRDATFWTPTLASPDAACRVLAATAPSRRDVEALRALTRLPVAALRAWPTTLSTARALLAVSGRLEPVPCPARRIAALDAAWLSRYPSVATTLREALRRETCPFVMARVWFPATQALAAFEAGDATATPTEFEDLAVGWQLIDGAWDRARTLLDPRFSRRRRTALARSFRESLGPLVAWSVARLDSAWADGTPWPRAFTWPSVLAPIDSLPRRTGWPYDAVLRAFDIPRYAVSGARRWNLDTLRVPANHPTLDAWIDYWRTGEFSPPHGAPPWLRDTEMRALVTAVAEGDRRALPAHLGAPTLRNAERLAVVAYRLDPRTASSLEAWLRRAWGSLDPAVMSLAAWEDALQTLHSCALRLRLDALRRDTTAALLRVRHLRRDGDGFVQAVLDGPRPAAPEPDDDE